MLPTRVPFTDLLIFQPQILHYLRGLDFVYFNSKKYLTDIWLF